MASSRVLVIYTGGTIGMVPVDPANPDGTRRPGAKEDVLRYIPAVGARDGIDWELLADPALPPVDSSDIGPREWPAPAAILQRQYPHRAGFVILHGTDTMAYTASALSFLCENLAKPVILTGSQTPLFHDRTDGRLNLIHSLRIAGYRATGLPLLAEVAICFGKRVVRGNRARKMSTTDSDAFDSPNLRPLGAIETDVFLDPSLRTPPTGQPFFVHKAMSTGVVDVPIVPGLPAPDLDSRRFGPDIRGSLRPPCAPQAGAGAVKAANGVFPTCPPPGRPGCCSRPVWPAQGVAGSRLASRSATRVFSVSALAWKSGLRGSIWDGRTGMGARSWA